MKEFISLLNIVLVLSLLVGGCAPKEKLTKELPTSAPTPTPVSPTPTPVPEKEREEMVQVHFWVSNQSLGTGISEVQMRVSLDGMIVFDQPLAVGTQHNIAIVDKDVSIGTHTVAVNVGDPYFLSDNIDVEISHESWILVRFWFDPQSVHENQQNPTITIDVFDKSPGIK